MKPTKLHIIQADEVNTGIKSAARTKVAKALSGALADAYTLMLKTQYYHWNVAGAHFIALHEMFGAQYTELFATVDELAERLRALGQEAPGTYAQFSKLTQIKEDATLPKNWGQMVQNLLDGHEAIARGLRTAIGVAEDADDAATADLLTGKLDAHEKTAWMLRAHLA